MMYGVGDGIGCGLSDLCLYYLDCLVGGGREYFDDVVYSYRLRYLVILQTQMKSVAE